MRTSAPALLPLFRSELQARILTRLLLDDDEIGMSELARDLGAPQATVYREASRLVDAGVLVDRWIGRTRMVSANRANPAFAPLRQLMEVVYGPKALLQAALADVTGIDEALIFGSWAARYTGKDGAAPGDIDLLVIGDPDVDALHLAVSSVEAQLHREVNFVVITPDTWAAREGDPFLARVSAGPTVVVAGVEP
jgi:DNA-binding transcriptional ArsR family regulator